MHHLHLKRINMKNIFITGAGSGMGQATAVLLSTHPEYRIICIGRNPEKLKITLDSMNRHQPHLCWEMDIRDQATWKQKLAENADIQEAYAIFANAGVGGENHFGNSDRWEEIISTNLTGTYLTVANLLPLLKNSDAPFKHIVITSSCLARFGVPRYTAYCTAKTGLLGLTRSLAVELATDHILVNAICPGWVETDMAIAGIQYLADNNGNDLSTEINVQKSFVPLNRFSSPEEIAAFVRFLISSEQNSITGQSLDINNGSFMI
jgi:NAD(P)-dependent dehydrogenase (short-subunit alcohol dehydrogenase family)